MPVHLHTATLIHGYLMNKISHDETLIECQWLVIEDQVKPNAACERIEWLVSDVLNLVKVDRRGWEKLYQDPADKRYWLLFYPQSELKGGGPASLMEITYAEADVRFRT